MTFVMYRSPECGLGHVLIATQAGAYLDLDFFLPDRIVFFTGSGGCFDAALGVAVRALTDFFRGTGRTSAAVLGCRSSFSSTLVSGLTGLDPFQAKRAPFRSVRKAFLIWFTARPNWV
jgi:hypothetical protein